VTRGELLHSVPGAKPLPDREDCLEVEHLPSEWISAGVVYVQDPSTLIPCELLAPKPGERVLDACAAPGGKACYLAQLMQNRGQLFAGDYEPLRLSRQVGSNQYRSDPSGLAKEPASSGESHV
jgi:16S rRNA (cytosine967-C5)-methyltransferase